MTNSIYVFTNGGKKSTIKRLHLCTWEFRNSKALLEFGCEIDWDSIKTHDEFTLEIYIPWLKDQTITNLYDSLKNPQNSKFIFNDSITNTRYIANGDHIGVIHEFFEQKPLCIIPVKLNVHDVSFISAHFDITSLKAMPIEANIYFRFYIETSDQVISIRKHGLNKSTILYDLRINEMRNLPDSLKPKVLNNQTEIASCFCLHIVPNDYEFALKDPSLKNIRTLETESFKRYLGRNDIKDEELVVMFNKKAKEDYYSFFSIFNKERIGAGQFAAATVVNLFSGLLLYLPTIRNFNGTAAINSTYWERIPLEFILALCVLFCYAIYILSKIPFRSMINK